MPSGSIGSHRAFMGVSITLCVILSLTLYVGWKWYFDSVVGRTTLITLAKNAEKRVQDLENLGINVEPPPPGSVTSKLPKIMAGSAEQPESPLASALKSAAPVDGSIGGTAAQQAAAHPAESTIKELPLQADSEEVIQALALLDQYWNTPSWKDRIPLVAHSEAVAARMKDYYETQGGKDPVPGNMMSKARYEIDGTEILYFRYSSSRPTGSLEIAMLRGPDKKFLIDWESLTGYGEMSFHEFRAQRPTKPVLMRTYVRLFDYYNYEFADAKRHLCVKLISENGESSIYGYCERGTPLARWIESDLATTGPTGFKGYIMMLSFPPHAQSNQCVNLERVMTPRWIKLP